jgi:purine catabolism regulator
MPDIAELLALPVFQRARPEVIIGDSATPVRWVHTSEIFDIGALLEGGEMLLTTGLGLVRESEPRMREYVRQIADRRAAGLFLELGRTFSAPPEPLVEEAGRQGLVFGVLHDVVPWVEITEAAHRVIIGEQVIELEQAHAVNQALTSAILDHTSVEDVASSVADVTREAVGLEHTSGEIEWIVPLADLTAQTLRLPISSVSTDVVALVIPKDTTPPLIREFLAGLLDAWSAIYGQKSSRSSSTQSARFVSLVEDAPNLKSEHRRLLMDAGLEPQRNRPTFAYSLFSRSGHLDATAVQREADQFFQSTVVIPTQGSLLLLARGRISPSLDGIEILAPIASNLRRQGRDITIIEGEPQVTLSGLGREIDDLMLLAAHPQVRRTKQTQFSRRETNLLRLLSHLDDVGRTEHFVNQELAPILAHDATHRPPLMPTLLAFLTTDSKTDTATQLGISRQAVHSRITLIEDLLDIGPESPLARRAAVTLAALVWQWRSTGSL